MPRSRGERAHGPYKHGRRWRVVLVGAQGARSAESFATRAEATAFLAAARIEAQGGGRTVREAVDAYLADETARGLRTSSTTRTGYSLAQLLGPDADHRPVAWLTRPGVASGLYERCRAQLAATTQLNALAAGQRFGAWLVKRGWARRNPFGDVDPVGRKRHGSEKQALGIDESRRLMAACMEDGGAAGAAVLAALLLGVRASELAQRDVRDLDDGGRVLWIRGATKTRSSARSCEVPEVLRPLLAQLAAGRRPEDPLFRDSDGQRVTRYWVHYHACRLQRAARVPELGAHALRRTQSRLATAGGATPEVVAAALGHASPAITALAYVDRDTAAAAQGARTLRVLQGGRR